MAPAHHGHDQPIEHAYLTPDKHLVCTTDSVSHDVEVRVQAPRIINRPFVPAIVLLVGLGLGSCTPISVFVSDRWPTWAGGMPNDVPPRPGAPGYDQFLLHQQGKDAAPANTNAAANSDNAPAVTSATPNQAVQARPEADRRDSSPAPVGSGLY